MDAAGDALGDALGAAAWDAVWTALGSGATVLASHPGLAQALAAEYDRRQLAGGRRSWPRPAIETLQAWLARAWARCGDRLLLSPAHELRLWQEIVAEAEAPLLDAAATAATAAEAWRLAHAWRLDWDSADWQQSEDTAAFGGWSRQFTVLIRQQGWITAAELPAAVAAAIRGTRAAGALGPAPINGRGSLEPPARLALAGFDQLTPALASLVAALHGAGAQAEV
ncbi:MAG: hypothetical protein ACRD1L_02105, partial [Terriglobales bacterium]